MFEIVVDGVTEEVFSVNALKENLRDQLIIYARDVIHHEVKNLGFPEDPIMAVDGKFNKQIMDINLGGKVEFFNQDIDIIDGLRTSYDRITELSPKGAKNPGDRFAGIKYKDFNYVYLNNTLVAQNKLELNRWLEFMSSNGFKKGDEIMFINVVPYARKLERLGVTSSTVGTGGRTKRTGKSRSGNLIERPNGTYYAAQRTMKRLMTGRAFVTPVKYIPFNISIGGMRSKYTPKHGGRPYLYPAVIIKPITGKGIIQ